MENAIGFVITWAILLGPPALIRLARKQPLSRAWAATALVTLFFANNIIFVAILDLESPPHAGLVFGAVVSWFILRLGSWMNSEWRP